MRHCFLLLSLVFCCCYCAKAQIGPALDEPSPEPISNPADSTLFTFVINSSVRLINVKISSGKSPERQVFFVDEYGFCDAKILANLTDRFRMSFYFEDGKGWGASRLLKGRGHVFNVNREGDRFKAYQEEENEFSRYAIDLFARLDTGHFTSDVYDFTIKELRKNIDNVFGRRLAIFALKFAVPDTTRIHKVRQLVEGIHPRMRKSNDGFSFKKAINIHLTGLGDVLKNHEFLNVEGEKEALGFENSLYTVANFYNVEWGRSIKDLELIKADFVKEEFPSNTRLYSIGSTFNEPDLWFDFMENNDFPWPHFYDEWRLSPETNRNETFGRNIGEEHVPVYFIFDSNGTTLGRFQSYASVKSFLEGR
jgi:hypothetical protein